MSHQMVSHLPDADMQAAPAALLRAAARAREIARQTRTGVVVVRNGAIVEDNAMCNFPSKELTGHNPLM